MVNVIRVGAANEENDRMRVLAAQQRGQAE